MNYLVTIGLEVHSTVKSKAKMFSASANDPLAKPNTCLEWLDLGFLGTLPVVNIEVVKKAMQLGKQLNMKINYDNIQFDRKNYFYHDLPKGYQITQYYYPIATNGYIQLFKNNKKIRIKQIQIEEDTAKQTVEDQFLNLDFNRCGTPLLEIVSEPDFTNASEVLEYLTFLKRTLVFTNISDGKIELGNLRVDLNISVRKKQTDPYGTKVEVKNIGSFSAIEKAINYEIALQIKQIENNQPILQETKRWDEENEKTVFMREKTDAVDYRFMPEPNLPAFSFSENEYQQIITNAPTTWQTIQLELEQAELSEVDINNLLDHYEIYLAVKNLNAILKDWKESYKWIAIEILGFLNKANLNYENLDPAILNELIKTILAVKIEQKINAKQAKIAFEEIINNNLTLQQVIEKHNMKQITDLSELENLITTVLEKNENILHKFLDNEIKFEKFIIGQVMAMTKGQANPNVLKTAYDNKAKKLLNK